jgi:hypothetical protein
MIIVTDGQKVTAGEAISRGGGNVGSLDGSVVWKNINQMTPKNQASSYTYYWGNWVSHVVT